MGRLTLGAFEAQPAGRSPPRRYKEVNMFTESTVSGHRAAPFRSRPRRKFHSLDSARHRRLLRTGTSAVLAIALILSIPGLASAENTEEPEVVILHDTDVSSALSVEVEPRCSELRFRSPEAKLRWSIDASAVPKSKALDDLMATTEFRIDVSKSPAGLVSGRFDSITVSSTVSRADQSSKSSGPRTAAYSAVVRDLAPGVYYHTRVLVRTPDGWVASSPIGFISPVCPVDGLDRD